MKTIKSMTVALLLLISGLSKAQININGVPPAWAPSGSKGEYYYMPDIESYYDVKSSQFIHFRGGRWVRSAALPVQYKNYDLYHGRTVVLTDYHGNAPYVNFNSHKVKYKGNNGLHKGHYKNNGNPGNKHGNGKGHGNGNGKH